MVHSLCGKRYSIWSCVVCERVCICKCVRMCAHVCVCTYIHMCALCVNMHVGTCVHLCVDAHVCMYAHVCFCVHACACVCTCVHVCAHVWVCMCECVRACVWIWHLLPLSHISLLIELADDRAKRQNMDRGDPKILHWVICFHLSLHFISELELVILLLTANSLFQYNMILSMRDKFSSEKNTGRKYI